MTITWEEIKVGELLWDEDEETYFYKSCSKRGIYFQATDLGDIWVFAADDDDSWDDHIIVTNMNKPHVKILKGLLAKNHKLAEVLLSVVEREVCSTCGCR